LVDDIWKDDVYGTWGTQGREYQRTYILVGRFVRNNPLGICQRRWGDNINTYIKEIGKHFVD
jgi:hypothetical protein